MSMRLGTSSICFSLLNDVRGFGVVLRLKRGHSSHALGVLHWLMRKLEVYHRNDNTLRSRQASTGVLRHRPPQSMNLKTGRSMSGPFGKAGCCSLFTSR